MPMIRVKDDVYERLLELKKSLGHASFSETIAYLLDRATSPSTFLESLAYFAQDIRKDIKDLKDTLKRLVGLLEQYADAHQHG